jgi:hypothetical protein
MAIAWVLVIPARMLFICSPVGVIVFIALSELLLDPHE